jgi:transporter family protein
MQWLLFAALSAFFAALVAILGKVGLETVDSTVATAVRAAVMMIVLVTFAVLAGKGSQLARVTSKDMGFIILSGIAGAASWLFFFAALKQADATQVSIVDRASVLIVMVLSALLLGEQITLKKAASGILSFAGLLLLTINLD